MKSIEDLLIKDVGKAAHPLVFPMLYGILGMVCYPIPMLIMDTKFPRVEASEVIYIAFLGLFSFCQHLFVALGLHNESASRVSMVNYMQLVFMFIADLCLFNKEFQVLDLIGTLLIFGFNFGNGVYKFSLRYRELNNLKSKE